MAVLHQYNQAFLQELDRLNSAQREAVEHIEGPVLVIAGPGTGKTHILAARIGRILMETDAQPHNILCLTFTDSGVQAMRQRLLELIGPEAHRVHIFTFHSFCNNIIQDHLELFGRRDLEPLSDLERVEIIRRILDELPYEHPLRQNRTDPYFYESHLFDLFQRMKREDWTMDFIHQKIREYLEDLPNREEFTYKVSRGDFKKGDVKTAQVEAVREKMERLAAAASLYPRFEQLMKEYRRYDYDDMILWVLRAFEEHSWLLRTYQEQYLYFLVDEYQDTNGAQNEVLHRLIEFWENPNVFIVGDDDQSIFEFQGARLKNIAEFYASYRHDLKVVVLLENYRSSQLILDTSRALIEHNVIRIINNLQGLGLEKILTARHEQFAAAVALPEFVEYPNRLHEEADIVNQLESLMLQGFPLDEVAVIYARHRQARRLIELLKRKGIPYRTRRSINILDLPLIQNLRLLLEYLNAEFHRPYSGEHWLFRILHFDFFGIPPHDLAVLAACLAKRSAGFQVVDPSGERVVSRPWHEKHSLWRNVIADKRFLKKCGIKNPEPFLQLSAFLEFMLAEYANLSAPAFLERLVNRSGLLHSILGIRDSGLGIWNGTAQSQIPNPKSQEKDWQLQVLYTFMSFVKKEAARSPRLTISRLLEILKSMDANRLPIQLAVGGWRPAGSSRQSAVDSSAVGSRQVNNTNSPIPLSFPEGTQSQVNLLTAHGAKGLEFQKVFLLDCSKDHWEPARQGGNYRFSFPDTLTLSGEEDAMEARRRLFYVAMTRAKETLHISYAARDDEGKELQRTVFVDELLQVTGLPLMPKEASAPSILETQTMLMLESLPAVQPPDREMVQAMLANFSMTISGLNQFLNCPLGFYFEHLLKVPVVQSESASFGTAMHNALRRGFEKMAASEEKQYPPIEEFVRFFEMEMQKLQGFFSRGEFERRLAMGRKYLTEYIQRNKPRWPQSALAEQEFRNVVVEGVPLTGIIDRIDMIDKLEVHIIDYKTGSHDASKLKKPAPLAKASKSQIPNPKSPIPDYGGSYWRQLVFYKILYENWRNNPRRVASAEISYLEPGARGDFPSKTIAFEPEDVAFVKNLIVETYGKIMRQEFFTGCGETDCSWCSFLKNQGRVDTFSEKEIEALDD